MSRKLSKAFVKRGSARPKTGDGLFFAFAGAEDSGFWFRKQLKHVLFFIGNRGFPVLSKKPAYFKALLS